MEEKGSVNYIYFGLFFVFLSFLHVYQIFLIENGSFLHHTFYMVYAIGQSLLETGGLMMVGSLLAKKFPRSLNPVFIMLTFALLIIHILDFPLVRMMDFSVWHAFGFIFAESFENFIEMLRASNISLKNWGIAGVVIVLLPVLGVVIFRLTNSIAKKRPLNFSYRTATLGLMATLLFLSLFDFRAGQLAVPSDESRFLKALPWKTTIFSTPYQTMVVDNCLRPPPKEKEALAAIGDRSLKSPLRKPNIFLFVIESLREDYIQPHSAPAFSQFRTDNISCDLSCSAANATQSSWFSLFHAKFPFYWRQMQPPVWNSGALPLQILKNAGYKIHVYTSSRFGYYQMDEVLFGKGRGLVDTFHEFTKEDGLEPYENDAQCFASLEREMESLKNEEGHLFLIFLESTHFDYSWPKRDSLRFTPIIEEVDYLKVVYSSVDMEGIKNRYRNAIFYLDTLFGSFSKKLKAMPHGDASVVVMTGDHGEEFFEEGRIFHASNLSTMQTQVPIYYKLGQNDAFDLSQKAKLTSHVDIFPTILDHVFGKSVFPEFFDGKSIFNEKHNPFVITARYNASRAPYEFFIHNGKTKCIMKFFNQRNIFESKSLQIISKRNLKGEPIAYEIFEIKDEFKPALDYLFVKE